ncbi:glycoside hydrolase family 26 protein [Streptomyces sp. 8N114]|uniref:glycoside hydrolase family 26 protein n=1 Tax=Streptomyces sp. 8N114 TaxID=3457419 RepID=UPI003FD39183
MRTHRRERIRAVLCGGAVIAGLLASCTVPSSGRPGSGSVPGERPARTPSSSASTPRAEPSGSPSAPVSSADPLVGAFLGSGPEGVRRVRDMERWLGGTRLRAGHTYLPGRLWSEIEGRPRLLAPWARWRHEEPGRLLVLNVPMADHNEAGLSDDRVRTLLREGAAGRFDAHYRTLAERLVRQRLADTVLVLGWEMNGTTYTHRCGPDPAAWKAYWRRIVATMRSVPGQRFRFDFAPSRGRDAIPWTRCYPGDDVVDVLGMDAYDQPEGMPFEEQVREPYGLQAHVDFAARHGKPVSYPEWGLFRNGDNAEYVRRMLAWMDRYRPLYHTISDYCPHGVWGCHLNPVSSAMYRMALSAEGQPWWERCWGFGEYCVRLDWLGDLAG